MRTQRCGHALRKPTKRLCVWCGQGEAQRDVGGVAASEASAGARAPPRLPGLRPDLPAARRHRRPRLYRVRAAAWIRLANSRRRGLRVCSLGSVFGGRGVIRYEAVQQMVDDGVHWGQRLEPVVWCALLSLVAQFVVLHSLKVFIASLMAVMADRRRRRRRERRRNPQKSAAAQLAAKLGKPVKKRPPPPPPPPRREEPPEPPPEPPRVEEQEAERASEMDGGAVATSMTSITREPEARLEPETPTRPEAPAEGAPATPAALVSPTPSAAARALPPLQNTPTPTPTPQPAAANVETAPLRQTTPAPATPQVAPAPAPAPAEASPVTPQTPQPARPRAQSAAAVSLPGGEIPTPEAAPAPASAVRAAALREPQPHCLFLVLLIGQWPHVVWWLQPRPQRAPASVPRPVRRAPASVPRPAPRR